MTDFQSIACSFVIPESEHTNRIGREHQIGTPDLSTIPFVYNARFAELLNTNDPPETTDLPFLTTSLESARSILARLDDRNIVIQSTPEETESAKSAVMTAIAQHQAILNPARSIPDDILLTIFQWCSFSDTPWLESVSPPHAPWTLSHVSRHWRTLSISSPCLWSKIDIISRDLNSSTSHERHRIFRLDLRLRRSAECDLFVRVVDHLRAQIIFLHECFALILPTAHRWKTLTLTAHASALAHQFAECRFERLTKLNITFWDAVPHVTWHIPNIRDLSLSGCPVETVDLPWERVTRYACDEDGLIHLPKLSALEHLSLDILMFERALEILTSSGISFPLTLPSVRSISMKQEYNYQAIDKLSDFLLLPSLITLTICMGHDEWRFPRFDGSIRRFQNLSIISSSGWGQPSVHDHDPDEAALRSFFAKCTSVMALYLDMNIAEEEILHALADECALPKLTSLRVAVQSMWENPGLVVDLVEFRCQDGNAAAPLTELRIVEVENTRTGWWTQAETVTADVLERWNAICSKMNVLTVFENDF